MTMSGGMYLPMSMGIEVRYVHAACRSTGLTIITQKALEQLNAEHFLLWLSRESTALSSATLTGPS